MDPHDLHASRVAQACLRAWFGDADGFRDMSERLNARATAAVREALGLAPAARDTYWDELRAAYVLTDLGSPAAERWRLARMAVEAGR